MKYINNLKVWLCAALISVMGFHIVDSYIRNIQEKETQIAIAVMVSGTSCSIGYVKALKDLGVPPVVIQSKLSEIYTKCNEYAARVYGELNKN